MLKGEDDQLPLTRYHVGPVMDDPEQPSAPVGLPDAQAPPAQPLHQPAAGVAQLASPGGQASPLTPALEGRCTAPPTSPALAALEALGSGTPAVTSSARVDVPDDPGLATNTSSGQGPRQVVSLNACPPPPLCGSLPAGPCFPIGRAPPSPPAGPDRAADRPPPSQTARTPLASPRTHRDRAAAEATPQRAPGLASASVAAADGVLSATIQVRLG